MLDSLVTWKMPSGYSLEKSMGKSTGNPGVKTMNCGLVFCIRIFP